MGLGKTYSTKYLLDSNNNSGVAGQVLSTTSTGIDWVDANTVPGSGLWLASGNNIYNSNSGNVGIGTTSPVGKLEIQSSVVRTSVNGGADELVLQNAGYSGMTILSSNTTAAQIHFGDDAMSNTGMIQYWNNTNSMVFSTNGGSERMRIDSSGNVGIGTTSPNQSAAASSSTVVSTKAKTSGGVAITELIGLANNDNDKAGLITFISQNATSPLASIRGLRYTSDTTGKLAFFTSGTEKMRIDYNGNVGIGVTGPNEKLEVNGAVAIGNATDGIKIRLTGTVGEILGLSTTSGSYNDLDIRTQAATQLYLKTDGNVGIGTASPGAKLEVAGEIRVADGTKATPSYSFTNDPDTGMFSDLANTLRFGTGANTRMTIEPSGEVGINTTGPSAALHLRALTTNGVPFKLEGDANTTVEQMLIITSKAYNSSDAWYNLVAQAGDGSGGATNTCIIERDGDLRNKNNSYGQISDSRLKENIIDATPKLDDVMKVKVKNFNFIGEDLKQIGVVAQELEEVFPGLVKEDKQPDLNGEEGGVYKSVKYSVLVPILVKAMQEQQEIIEDLKTRITKLEN